MRSIPCVIQYAKTPQSANQGFTLVEALIAGVLMTFVMTSVGQLSVSSLASSGNQNERSRIEGAIENSIQEIQHLDSQLRYTSIPDIHLNKNDQYNACIAPGAYLAHRLAYGSTTQADWESVSNKGPDTIDLPYGVDSLKLSYLKPSNTTLYSLAITTNSEGNTVVTPETRPVDGNPYNLESQDINLTVIEYQFRMPESTISKSNKKSNNNENEKDNKLEKRIIELNPYFQGSCYEL